MMTADNAPTADHSGTPESLTGRSLGYQWTLRVPPTHDGVPGYTELTVTDAEGATLSRDGFADDVVHSEADVSTFWGASTGAPQRVILRAHLDVHQVELKVGARWAALTLQDLTQHDAKTGVMLIDESGPRPTHVAYQRNGQRLTRTIRTLPPSTT